MLTKISTATVGKDVVTLYRNDDDGTYLFSADGPKVTGMGCVGGNVHFVKVYENGSFINVDAGDDTAVADVLPWADASVRPEQPEGTTCLTINGATYKYGWGWTPLRNTGGWGVGNQSLMRTNGTMSESGRDRAEAILTAARDLFLGVPGVERELTRSALRRALRATAEEISEAHANLYRIQEKLAALGEPEVGA